jgi:ribosomal protein S18 acetylase RimI-like enzyme
MSTALHLAKTEHFEKLDGLVAQFHAEIGLDISAEHRESALIPLLEGIPHGAVYLLGMPRAPVGYVVVNFGWSIEIGGLGGFVDELFVRPSVRRRGIASEVLIALPKALAAAGVKALHLEVDQDDEATQRLYKRAHFATKERSVLMSSSL